MSIKLSDKNLLLASLLGSKLVKKSSRFEVVQNELRKHVLPTLSFLPIKNSGSNNLGIENQFFPLTFKRQKDTKQFTFPYEPMINISGKNNIVKREVAKKKNLIGSIKERWSQNDYDITITGILMGSLESGSVKDCYPLDDFRELMEYISDPKGIDVESPAFTALGITRIVIEDYSFPFTKGENVQAYEIKAVSDFSYDLLVKRVQQDV